MKRLWSGIGVGIVLLAVAGAYIWQFGLPGKPAVAEAAALASEEASAVGAPADAQTVDGAIVADARVVPVEVARLSMATGGLVAELLVSEGETVAAGDLLLRLDDAQQQVAVAQATAQLQSAQARLDELNAGARQQEIDAAQAGLDAAIARRDKLANGSLPGQIAQAEAALTASSANLSKLYEGADESALIAARADLASAEAALTQAQRAYDLVSWRADIGALPQSAQLQQATTAWEAAQARLDLLQSGPSSADVTGASAEVARQQAQLDTLVNSLPADLLAAEADVAFSQAQLDLLLAGARPEQLSVAEADVAAATASLQQALVALAETELRAPFTGAVAEITVAPGEQVSIGVPLLTLADLSQWQIETEDLTELDVTAVKPGAQVEVTFDALPDLTLAGTVKYIRPLGSDNRGDIVYTAVVTPASADPRLLWNMTAVVTLK